MEGRTAEAPLALAVALVALAGCVDAIGYLQFGHLFVSFMSGNSTQLGVSLGGGRWLAAARAGIVIALFVLGAFTGTLVAEAVSKWCLTILLALEASLLGSALLLPAPAGQFSAALFPTVLAMGLQNEVMTRAGGRRVSLTYVTGTLVRFGQELAEAITGCGEGWAWSGDGRLWLAMVAGATGGAALFAWVGFAAFAIPAMAALILATASALAGSRSGAAYADGHVGEVVTRNAVGRRVNSQASRPYGTRNDF
jgi:uncharacterized membrane protein YoaK (UPF0700 family)